MRHRYLTLGLSLVLLLPACNKDALDKVNPNGGTPDSYYANAIELTQGVNAIYALVQGTNLVGREYFFTHDLRSDDVATGGGQLEAPRAQLLTGSHTPANAVMNSVWNGFYRVILRANAVIANGPEVQPQYISEDLRKRLIGEAQFLRAWAYYNLVSLWGGVPLYTKPSESLEETEPRASVEAVYALIISDLTAAQTSLPTTYDGDNKGRATSGAAQALLGKVYVQKGDYAAAKPELEKVVNSGVYSLVPNYEDNFKEETGFNNESVFEIGYAGQTINWGSADGDGVHDATVRTQEYNAIGWRNLVPSDALLADYERVSKGDAKNDPRFGYNFYRIGDKFNNGADEISNTNVQGNESNFEGKREKISWKKYTSIYKNNINGYYGPMNMRIIRYADVLLLLAECENEVGTAANAIDYLNQVRTRPSVAMPPYPTANYPVNSKAEILRAVQHERRVELAGEQVRNFDILRWRQQGKIAEPISYFQANKQELLPIPQDEISNNPKLTQADQNPGY
jgi:starch-binding outer membrane protein, SusD/RagB family